MSIKYEGSFDFSGLEARLAAALPDALRGGAEVIGALSDDKVPVLVDLKKADDQDRADPGELKRSRYVLVEGTEDAVIGYSDDNAKRQHEELSYHHDVGQAKFLESAMVEGKDEALQVIADKIRERL